MEDVGQCERIFEMNYLALNYGFYKSPYRADTALYYKVFDLCLQKLGKNAYQEFDKQKLKEEEEHLNSRPPLDSSLRNTNLIMVLKEMQEDDQKYRLKLADARITIPEDKRTRMWKLQKELDALNLLKADSILSNFGYPSAQNVGYDLDNVIWFVLQHQENIETREKYLDILEENLSEGHLEIFKQRTQHLKNSLELEAYSDRVAACLENAKGLEFEIVGSDKKGVSHNVKADCLVGAKLPEFETIDMDNNTISSDNIKGKINVLNFWFINCAPCIAEIPSLNILFEKYKTDEINFLAIGRDNPNEIKKFLTKHPFHFTIIPNGNDLIKNKFHLMWGYPFTMITDSENRIIKVIEAADGQGDLTNAVIDEIESVIIR